MKKYKVLWIDDEYEKLSYLMERCEQMHGFEITKCRFAEEGMKVFEQHLDKWSAVVLDAKMLLRSLDEATRLVGLRFCRDRIKQLSSRRYVPHFVFTGQPDLISNDMFEEMVEKFYSKGDDDDQLITDIIEAADKLIETRILNEYSDVCEWYPNSKELIKILSYLEEERFDDPSVFNLIRKEFEWLMKYFIECNLLPVQFYEKTLNECSRELTNRKYQSLIPSYVQKSLYSAVFISNEGSHKIQETTNDEVNNKVDHVVRKCKAPYVVQSTIYELLNIIHWAKSLPKSEYGLNDLREKVKHL